jgi:hypothetical protein
MKKFLMLKDTLMKYSIHFSLFSHLQKKYSVILCKMVRLHTAKKTILALRGVFGEFNGEERIISKSLWSPISPDLKPCDFYLWGKLTRVVYANNPHDLEALKQNICEANLQHSAM